MFSINCLEITATKDEWKKGKDLYKNILSEKDYEEYERKDPSSHDKFRKRFFFNNFYKHNLDNEYPKKNDDKKQILPPDFFGKNINIQAIVGKNGSGKSTLMDLMYMAINNFCYMFERGKEKAASAPLYYVKNLYIKLYYTLDDVEYCLESNGDKIKLFRCPSETKIEFELSYTDSMDQTANIIDIVKPFFYTIVSNYSLQSFISSNYNQEIVAFNKTTKKDDFPENVDIYGIDKTKSTLEPNYQPKIWIDSIFHKNDGYVDSIVLNPFRNRGVIDMEGEDELSKFRFIAFLIYDKIKQQEASYDKFIKSYSLNEIKYSLDDSYLQSKFQCGKRNNLVDFINKRLSQENDTTLKKLYNKYFQNKNEHSVNDAEKIAIFYAERKIKKIIERYESYKKFKFDSLDIDSFLLEINTKPSHITFKLNQTIHFLEYTTKEDSSWTTNSFDFDSYKNKTKFSFESIDDILINLPPPFLKYDIELEKKNKENINYKLLSSGELQLIQTLYTHAYHIQNLLSITDTSRVQYRNINLVFDELEICLHPEYQRKFLSNLIHLLEYFIKKEPKVQFNIFLITHSPFVLSDIPHTNILYMLTEEDLENNKVYPTHTFAQNIGEMLYDSFFMEKTIGEFAEEKLKELIRKKQGKKSLMSDDEAYAVLRAVGDPVIRSLIEEIDKVDGDIL